MFGRGEGGRTGTFFGGHTSGDVSMIISHNEAPFDFIINFVSIYYKNIHLFSGYNGYFGNCLVRKLTYILG